MPKLFIALSLFVAILIRSAIAQTSAGVSATELACPAGTQVLLRLEQANVLAYVLVDQIPPPGGGLERRAETRSVSPNEMPTTLDLSPFVGGFDARVTVQGQSPLAGYIGCSQWQARIVGGQPNAFLLKRAQQTPSSAPTPVTPAPVFSTPAAPAPVTPAPVFPTPAAPAPVTPAPVFPAPAAPTPVTPAPVPPDPNIVNGKLTYRGFTVDVTAIRSGQDYNAIISSIKHQIDIVADCGAKQEVLRFFQSQPIVVRSDLGDQSGHFDRLGVSIEDSVAPQQRPILLHELLHAYHFKAMPDGVQNSDILTFYNRAKSNRFYPDNSYVLSNVKEFFAVTASLYLWGNVDRPPHTRANLKGTQPVYYAWLGNLFGVSK
jgi:cell division septation protein DedD